MLRPLMSSQTASDSDPQGAPVLAEYAGLTARIDAFFAGVLARQAGAMRCQAGCAGCCQDGLSVSAIEAAVIRDYLDRLPAAQRRRIATSADAERGSTAGPNASSAAAADDGGSGCAFLDPQGRCAIYPVRPLVCRSQGLPLAYPADLVPADALRFAARDGRAVVCCPLNFAADAASNSTRAKAPGAADILDAERIDLVLAVLNRRFVAAGCNSTAVGADPTTASLARTSLRALARGSR